MGRKTMYSIFIDKDYEEENITIIQKHFNA